MVRGHFPSFIQKTDQERVQNIWEDLKTKFPNLVWEVTTKLDGSSCTYYHKDGDVGVCSRNLSLKLEGNENNVMVKFAAKKQLLEKMKEIGCNVAIQGEIMGPGIQGNRENLKEADFFVFDVFDIDKGRHCTPAERQAYLDKLEAIGVNLNHVPKHGEVTLEQFTNIEDILKFAEGHSINNKIREGVVFKSVSVVNGIVPSFKVINNQYLIKEN